MNDNALAQPTPCSINKLIANNKSRCILLFLSIFLGACGQCSDCLAEPIQKNEPEVSWWLTKGFKPSQIQLFNHPLESIYPEWAAVSLLSRDFFLKSLPPNEYHQIEQSRLSFSKTMDLNRDSIPETIVVGIYQSKTGETGRFLSIIQDQHIVKTFTREGLPGYSSLYSHKLSLRWYQCMQCNDYDLVSFNGSEYVIE